MGRTRTLHVKESLEELKALRPKVKGSRCLTRLNFIILVKEDSLPKMQLMAERLGVSLRSLDNWGAAYRRGGLDALILPDTRNKGSRLISQEVHDALEERLDDPHGGFRGYWDAHQWVRENFGCTVSYNWLREYIRDKFKGRLKVPRKSNVKKDPAAIAVFKKPQNHL